MLTSPPWGWVGVKAGVKRGMSIDGHDSESGMSVEAWNKGGNGHGTSSG